MSDSNRNGVPAVWIAFSCVLVAVAGYMIWGELRNSEPTVANEYEVSRYADRAQNRIDRICADRKGGELLHCEYEVEPTERENYRAQKDLRAQWYMAIWAGFMTLFTFGTLIVTGLGVYFFRQTLHQTAKTNEAAVGAAMAANTTNEIMRNEQRPWLNFEINHIRPQCGMGLCCTNPMRDSFFESSVVAGVHEQTYTPRLQDQKLASLQ
jgi:hypothetical protein